MAQTFLIFDFGTDEEAAQQARHRIEGWKQGFRLGKKVQFKFERQSSEKSENSDASDEAKPKSKKKESEEDGSVRLLVRLDVKEQRFAVWNKITGVEIYRSEPFRPIVEPLGPQPVLSQDGTTAMVYWPDNVITPRLFPIP